MIKSNELRIGNVIAFYDGSTDIVKVDYIYRSDDMWFVQWTKIYGNGSFDIGNSILEDFEPVNLTPEILEKAGFSCDGDDSMNDYWLDELRIAFHIHDGVVEWCGHRIYEFIPPFHQLQNLYFALTGEELQIDLSVIHTS